MMMPKSRFRKLLDTLKKPFVFIGLALAALAWVLYDMFTRGKRSEKLDNLKKETERETEAAENAASRGDAGALKRDIIRRSRKK